MMEKYELELRHRPRIGQSIEEKHIEFLAAAQKLSLPFGPIRIEDCRLPSQEDNLTTTVVFDGQFGKGIKGFVTYQLRSEKYLEDRAQFDDIFIAEFRADKVNFRVLAFDVLPSLITAFGAYRAAVRNVSLAIEDWPVVAETVEATGKDVDGRDGVYRINGVNFWDETLCERAFGRKPVEIVNRLSSLVPIAQIVDGGAYIVCVDDYPSTSNVREFEGRLRRVLE
jgi:hypothetical protein